jgi:hypothetical protein
MAASRLSEVTDNVYLFCVALKERRQGKGCSHLVHGHHEGAEIKSSLHIPFGGY